MRIFLSIALLLVFLVSASAQPNFGDSVQVSVAWDFQIQNGSSGAVGDGQSGTTCPQIQILVNGSNVQDFDWFLATPGSSQSFDSDGGSSSAGNFTQGQSITLSIVMGGNTVWQSQYTVSATYNDGNFWHAYPVVGSGTVIVVGNDCSVTNQTTNCTQDVSYSWTDADSVPHGVLFQWPDGKVAGPFNVTPGQSISDIEEIPCGDSTNYQTVVGRPTNWVQEDNPTNFPGSFETNAVVTTNDNGTVTTNQVITSSPDSNGSPLPLQGQPTNNILWSAASSVNDDSGVIAAIKDSASVLFNSGVQIGSQAHSDALGISADLLGLSNSLAQHLNGGTNVFTLTNYAQENTLVGMSNLLANGLGNTTTSNILSLTNYAEESTLLGISNLLAGFGTNGFDTNELTNVQLTNDVANYQSDLTNQQGSVLSQMEALTNQAGQFGLADVVGSVSGLGSVTPSTDSGGSGAESDIDLGHGIVLALGTNMPVYSGLREVIVWSILLGLFFWNWRTFYLCCRDAFTAQQAHTSGTELMGTNVNMSSALLMAIAIVAVASAIPAFAAALLSGELTLFSGLNPTELLSSGSFGFAFLNQYIPFLTLITAVISRVIFTVSIQSITSVVMAVKLFLVGL